MTKLVWNDVGERFFETGLDRGVLYVSDDPGVPWNGLVSISKNTVGGSARPLYIDGVKVRNYSMPEETALTLTAFFSPPEFEQCDGTLEIIPGFSIHHQVRKEFGLTYRSNIGNDLDGSDHGYKIHFIYNALAAPANTIHETETPSSNIQPLSWELSTRPLVVKEYVSSAHLELDTTKLSPGVVNTIEEILYGSDTLPSRIPQPNEIVSIIAAGDDSGVDVFTDIFREVF